MSLLVWELLWIHQEELMSVWVSLLDLLPLERLLIRGSELVEPGLAASFIKT